MKTGIVRRIDELGRVVIPKEIRKTMRLKNGEELEIIAGENELVLKKYSALFEYKQSARDMGIALRKSLELNILVTDTEKIVFASPNEEELCLLPLSAEYIRLMEKREPLLLCKNEKLNMIVPEPICWAFAPVLCGGDLIGSFAAYSASSEIKEGELTALKTAAAFIAAQFEA